VNEFEELRALLTRAAQVMEASGLVVWLGNTAGADLRPVLAHGYSEQAIARMPAVPRAGHNAAAAAYRTGALQIVLSQPGGSTGAIVAPLLSADGCIGALSVEIKGGGETSDSVQALAAIFAAQLAGVLSVPAADVVPTEQKAAAQG
jgi:GAF domain-containing protein